MNQILNDIRYYVKQKLENEGSGHDWHHIERVVQHSEVIAKAEGANHFVCIAAALVHDLADDKIASSEAEGIKEVVNLLGDVNEEDRNHIIEIISSISFKGGNRPPVTTLEAQVVQDADRLDAIGAIGIARTFVYAGSKGDLIYDPSIEPRNKMTPETYRNGQSTAINHFYEKLLNLKELMNTQKGIELAKQRHEFMEEFLSQFHDEWAGIK
ncbi:HD domain-containing protein [Pseudalkalibacillus hwajinpoensis]|uniref:HD domain-containing protein n=1 Tax=Guptibacillus hwajinpoensis TaxID=208199 RepID=A0A4U1MLA8_9BACL|nr:HD domain-containing protein [Pseudalkalibacillus hwajinpoensis]TKD71973.1 HD domain-containing protein [Pseudalkalibacillus hwajinpoensis]